MNYGEGLVFTVAINLDFIRYVALEDCVINICTKIVLADRPISISNNDLNKFRDRIFMAFQVAYKPVRPTFVSLLYTVPTGEEWENTLK
jgi:hypothetical protein